MFNYILKKIHWGYVKYPECNTVMTSVSILGSTFSTLSLIHSLSLYRTAVHYLGLINDAIVSWCDHPLVDWIGIIAHQASLLELQEHKCLSHEKKSTCFVNEFNVFFIIIILFAHVWWIVMFLWLDGTCSVLCTRLSEIMSGNASSPLDSGSPASCCTEEKQKRNACLVFFFGGQWREAIDSSIFKTLAMLP